MKTNPLGGQGRARLRQAPTALGSGVVAGVRMVRGCRGLGDSGWNENEPSGGPGKGLPVAIPYGVGIAGCGCQGLYDGLGMCTVIGLHAGL